MTTWQITIIAISVSIIYLSSRVARRKAAALKIALRLAASELSVYRDSSPIDPLEIYNELLTLAEGTQ